MTWRQVAAPLQSSQDRHAPVRCAQPAEWQAGRAFAEAALRQSQETPGAPALPAGRALVANFAELSPDAAMFPVDHLRAAMDKVLHARGAGCSASGTRRRACPSCAN